ncbi:hypothetical protein L3Y34_009819 [Caenorhabditis briggsae]|uniref:Peptidase C1A papain C-terminal domain-containing protein n=1 Tax=Caenorhabditis briggsae TaxID=6238 RepID=A0AAE9A823_CAEBR|nr:hypothetical protein L3Y34_009819 [Caenorhabditis briggsae]
MMKAFVFAALLAVTLAFVPIDHQSFVETLTGKALVDYVNSVQSLFITEHVDVSEEFMKSRVMNVNTVLATIPETFDARTKWPKCKSIKLIRNQANCRSCWAFGAAEVISDRICIATKGARQPIISPMDMVDCCGKYCGYGCDGTSAYYVGMTVSAIQTEIMTNGPVVGVFTMYEDMYKYKSGVYRHTAGRLLGGHAIKIIGWGTQNGIPYWLIANSWGTKWGENGFFKIRGGVNECGIENNVVAGKVDVDTL